MTTWELHLEDQIITPDDGLYDVPEIQDTFNPFANYGVATIDDTDGTQYDKFPRGTRVDFVFADEITDPDNLYVNDTETKFINNNDSELWRDIFVGGTINVGGTLNTGERDRTTRLQGFVVERREIEDNGADKLEIEVYSLDQLLRGNTVSANTNGKTIKEALESIIINDTPVTWVASNVTVEDNITLTRNLRGEKVDNALLILSFLSANERIRVNDDIEFEFTPQEQTQAPRDINQDQWFFADKPEEGKEVINECRVFYNDGNDRVTVSNGADKLALQDSLGLDDPFSTVKEVSRPDITELNDAKDIGNKILNNRDTTLPITVTTFGLETAKPGEVITVDIPQKGISGDFEIASWRYDWGNDETEFILVENSGYQDELLVRVVDAIDRIELEGVNRDADDNRITDTRVGVTVSESATATIDDISGVFTDSFDNSVFTNKARNLLRDKWADTTIVDITKIAYGSDNSNLSRTNTSLESETGRATVSQTLPDSDTVEFDASFSAVSASEAGLFDSNGNLIARATFDSTVDNIDNIKFTLDIADDGDVDRGVFTADGQTAVRDILADNSPKFPTQYAYGQDGTDPAESDTSLGNQSIKVPLDTILLRKTTTNTQFENNKQSAIADDDALEIINDEIQTLQSSKFKFPADSKDESPSSQFRNNVANAEDNFIYYFISDGDFIEWDFSPEYRIPNSRIRVAVRGRVDDSAAPTANVFINGNETAGGVPFTVDDFTWQQVDDMNQFNGDLEPDQTYTIRVESDGTGDGTAEAQLDCLAVQDSQFSYNYPADTDSNDLLSGPEDYPDLVEVDFSKIETQRKFKTASVESTWNEDPPSNKQFIELSQDDSTFTTTNNSTSASVTFASEGRTLYTRAGLSRFGSRTTETPTAGFNGHAIETWQEKADLKTIFPNSLAEAIVEGAVGQGEITGDRLEEAGQLASDDTLLTRSVFAPFDVFSDTSIRSSEKVGFDIPE